MLLDMNLIVLSCEITDRRMYVKCVDRSIEKDIPFGRKMGDGVHQFFDTVSPAITVSNSETGSGRLLVETGIYTKACTNLALIGANFKKHHLGARAEMSDDVYALLSDRTKQMGDVALWNQVRDVVRGAFQAAQFDATCKRLQASTGIKIAPENVSEVVERFGRKFTLNLDERKGVLARLIEGGDLSLYGMHSAVTRHSQDVVEYDRATELERIGGDIIDMPDSQVRDLVMA